MESKEWYSQTKKPKWSPPSWLFGPVWSILYIFIFISFGYVFVRVYEGDMDVIVLLPFVLNILFNILFSPIQWKLRSNLLASIDIFLMIVTLVWIMVSIYNYYPWVTYMQMGYLLWICFAFVLQVTITRLNWDTEKLRELVG
jgi:tryptophan-rich sensory protein